MIDLKKTKQQLKDEKKAYSSMSPSEMEKYPWGTTLRFDKPIIDKMPVVKKGIVGEMVKIEAVGKITEASKNERTDGSTRHNVEIQITKIEITGSEKDMPSDEKDAFEEKE